VQKVHRSSVEVFRCVLSMHQVQIAIQIRVQRLFPEKQTNIINPEKTTTID
jgi:hypothetical protein